jgi:hypothetical protein
MRAFSDAAVRGDNGEERHKAVVTDRLLHRNTKDRVSHRWPERRRPLGTDGTIVFAEPILGHAGIIHQMPDDVVI